MLQDLASRASFFFSAGPVGSRREELPCLAALHTSHAGAAPVMGGFSSAICLIFSFMSCRH